MLINSCMTHILALVPIYTTAQNLHYTRYPCSLSCLDTITRLKHNIMPVKQRNNKRRGIDKAKHPRKSV